MTELSPGTGDPTLDTLIQTTDETGDANPRSGSTAEPGDDEAGPVGGALCHPVLADVLQNFEALREEVQRLHESMPGIWASVVSACTQAEPILTTPPETPEECDDCRRRMEDIFVSFKHHITEAVSPLLPGSNLNKSSVRDLAKRVYGPFGDFCQSYSYLSEKFTKQAIRQADLEREQAFREQEARRLEIEAARLRAGGNSL